MKIGDKVKLNDTLCSNGTISKINEDLGVCTVYWYNRVNLHYQQFYIEYIMEFNQIIKDH